MKPVSRSPALAAQVLATQATTAPTLVAPARLARTPWAGALAARATRTLVALPLIALAALAISTTLVSPSAKAQPAERREYTLLASPQPPESGSGKIEVIEFFSYACPHCFHFNPLITSWAAKLPKNVSFIRIPVAFGRAEWGQLVRTYYALQATGDLARLDTPLFDAIHKEGLPLFNEANITDWVAKHGVNAAAFTAAFNSFSVTTKATHAEQLVMNYKVDGVPKLVVGGKYVIQANDFQQLLVNADQVLSQIKAPAASAKPVK